MDIPVRKYLEYALSFNNRERALVDEFKEWLPQEIIDCHGHANRREHCLGIDDDLKNHPGTTFPWFNISTHLIVNNLFYPEKTIKMLLFSFPYRGIDLRAANLYIASESTQNSMVIPILCGLPDDFGHIRDFLKMGRFYGLKMHPACIHPTAHELSEYLSDEILLFMESQEGTIILHLPSPITECLNSVVSAAKKFPRVKIVLAHMGLAYLSLRNLSKTFQKLATFKNIFLDTSLVTSTEVLKMGLDSFGHERILFGTDQPLNLIRGKFYQHPKLGPRILTNFPYHWLSPIEEERKILLPKAGLVHLHWEILIALHEAISYYGNSEDIKNCIFSENTKRVFQL